MRRLIMLMLCLILMAGIIVMPASAESAATKVESYITVTNNGDAMVSTTVRLRLDSPVESLAFPVPLDATDITLNGGSARTTKTATAIEVDLSRLAGGMTGEIPIALNYNLPGAVQIILSEENKDLQAGYSALIALAKGILERCIDLLGFSAPEKM